MTRFKQKKAGRQHEPSAVWTYQFREHLPSRDEHLAFGATVRLDWSVEDTHRAAGTSNLIAARHVRRIVEKAAVDASVLRISAAEQDISFSLANNLPCSADGVRVHRAQITLHVDEDTLETARRLERVRQEKVLDSLHQDRLRARIGFMRTEALRDPAAARLYWLLEHPNHPNPQEQAKALEELVQQVSLWDKEDRWVIIAKLLHRFIERLPESRRDRLVDQLGKIFVEYGQGDLAEQLPVPSAVPSLGPAAVRSGSTAAAGSG